MTEDKSPPISLLNQLSEKNTFSLDDLSWDLAVDQNKNWAPENMNPLFYLPGYFKLDDRQKRRANQLFAMGICEQFIWFEKDLLCRVLKRVLKLPLPGDLRQALINFKEEEEKHTEMFWRLLERADRRRYTKRRFGLFNLSRLQSAGLKLILFFPKFFLGWLWLAILFEERTLDYSRRYGEGHRVDALFSQCHRFHMKDESRHYQLDQHLLEFFYDDQPRWKKNLASKIFYRVMKAYTSPKRTGRRILKELRREFPELETGHGPQLDKEFYILKTSLPFHKMAFSAASLGRTFRLLARYPEMDRLWPLFVAEKKENFSSKAYLKKDDLSSIDGAGPRAFL